MRSSWGQRFERYLRNNVLATQHLLEASRETPAKRFVYASSSSVYGQAEPLPTPRDAPPRPFSPYGVTKLAAEHLCGLYHGNHGARGRVAALLHGLRPAPAARHGVQPLLPRRARGAPIEIFGDGGQTRDFTFVADVVARSAPPPTADVAGGRLQHRRRLPGQRQRGAGAARGYAGRPLKVERRRGAGDVRDTGADTTRARRSSASPPHDVRRRPAGRVRVGHLGKELDIAAPGWRQAPGRRGRHPAEHHRPARRRSRSTPPTRAPAWRRRTWRRWRRSSSPRAPAGPDEVEQALFAGARPAAGRERLDARSTGTGCSTPQASLAALGGGRRTVDSARSLWAAALLALVLLTLRRRRAARLPQRPVRAGVRRAAAARPRWACSSCAVVRWRRRARRARGGRGLAAHPRLGAHHLRPRQAGQPALLQRAHPAALSRSWPSSARRLRPVVGGPGARLRRLPRLRRLVEGAGPGLHALHLPGHPLAGDQRARLPGHRPGDAQAGGGDEAHRARGVTATSRRASGCSRATTAAPTSSRAEIGRSRRTAQRVEVEGESTRPPFTAAMVGPGLQRASVPLPLSALGCPGASSAGGLLRSGRLPPRRSSA